MQAPAIADGNVSILNRIGGKRDAALILVCVGLIVLGVAPILDNAQPGPTLHFLKTAPGWQMAGRILLLALVAGAILLTGWLDGERGAVKVMRLGGFVLIAALLTDVHYYTRDIYPEVLSWQMDQFNKILLHTDPPPDQYRFLPQGILWWMVLGNGDFLFSYLAYRFLFTFLVCQAIYKFARVYLAPRDAIIVVLIYSAFYPLSTRYYNGNLLDPMSHAVMLAALTCCARKEFVKVLCLFALGMFIKETMLVVIPCYYLMNLETFSWRDSRLLGRLALLGAAGVALFLACRLPFHFSASFESLNRTSSLMIASNLGFAWKHDQASSGVSVFQRYMHPILFIFMWLPLIIWRRKVLARSLFWTALYLSAALYFTNLCFGWNYESRNFVPALVVLAVCAVEIVNGECRMENAE